MILHKQLSLPDIFSDCQEKFENDKPTFLSLLENHIDLDEIIPTTFYNHFYASTGRSRKYSLHALLWALIIQRIFSIPTDQLLLTFLTYSKPLRQFCGFTKVPDASKITRFKQDFQMICSSYSATLLILQNLSAKLLWYVDTYLDTFLKGISYFVDFTFQMLLTLSLRGYDFLFFKNPLFY